MELAQELAQRISISLDNIRLFQDNVRAIKTRDDFMSICSHELNTPLQTMKFKTQTLHRRLKRNKPESVPTSDMVQFIDSIDTQVQRLARLVGDMLDLAGVRGGKLALTRAPMDLTQMVRRAVEATKPALERAGNTVTLCDDGPLVGKWDSFRLEQVFLNLLANAMKYGPNAPIHITCKHRGQHAILHIRDHGRGIAEEDQERVFRRFERSVSRSEVSGLGLGLYISRKILRAHGGNIRIRSKLGIGTTLIVSLPTCMPAHKRPRGTAARQGMPAASGESPI